MERRRRPDELPIEDILTVKHDVIPLNGAEVLQQGSIDSIGLSAGGDLPAAGRRHKASAIAGLTIGLIHFLRAIVD